MNTSALQRRRAYHAGQAALLRRFADENVERGLDHFAALDLTAAAREQAKANDLTMALRVVHRVMQ